MSNSTLIQETVPYPGVSERIKAAIIDSFVIVAFLFIATFVIAEFDEVSDIARIACFIFIFGLYDPIFTTIFGGTIGHMAANIRVKKVDNESKNIGFLFALLRFVVKALLGIFSLFTVGSHPKHLALHDLVAKSIVVRNK